MSVANLDASYQQEIQHLKVITAEVDDDGPSSL